MMNFLMHQRILSWYNFREKSKWAYLLKRNMPTRFHFCGVTTSRDIDKNYRGDFELKTNNYNINLLF